MYTVIVLPKALKQLERLHQKDQVRIISAMKELAHVPFGGKKMNGELQGLYGIRVWPYRVLYKIEKHIITVTVVAIGHRKDVYRKS